MAYLIGIDIGDPQAVSLSSKYIIVYLYTIPQYEPVATISFVFHYPTDKRPLVIRWDM